MTPYKAQRIRFGILAARHALERWRLTEWQADFLEGCETVGWAIKYSARAFRREFDAAHLRFLDADWQAYLDGGSWDKSWNPKREP